MKIGTPNQPVRAQIGCQRVSGGVTLGVTSEEQNIPIICSLVREVSAREGGRGRGEGGGGGDRGEGRERGEGGGGGSGTEEGLGRQVG